MSLCLPVGCMLAAGKWSLIDMLVVALAMCAVCQVVLIVRGRNRLKAVADFLRCGVCGYNLTGHKAMIGEPWARCPECGEPLQEVNVVKEGQLHAEEMRRSTRRINLVSGAICLVGIAITMVIQISRGMGGGRVWLLALVATGLLISLAVAYWRRGGRML